MEAQLFLCAHLSKHLIFNMLGDDFDIGLFPLPEHHAVSMVLVIIQVVPDFIIDLIRIQFELILRSRAMLISLVLGKVNFVYEVDCILLS